MEIGRPSRNGDERKTMKNEETLMGLAKQYYEETEAFDRTVCTGPIRKGVILPATPNEHSLVNRNARMLNAKLEARAAALGFTRSDWLQARKRASHN